MTLHLPTSAKRFHVLIFLEVISVARRLCRKSKVELWLLVKVLVDNVRAKYLHFTSLGSYTHAATFTRHHVLIIIVITFP